MMLGDKKIAVYGDSILRGIGLDEGDGKYHPIKESSVKMFEDKFGVNIKNRSHFGFTVDMGLNTLMKDISSGNKCDLALIELGGNDCNFNWAEVAENPDAIHEPVTILSHFESVYRTMITKLKESNALIAVMNLPPIGADRYFKWITKSGLSAENILKWLGDTQMIYRFQELYSNAVTRIAYETKSVLVDVRSAFLCRHDYTALLCGDGIHPSPDGQRLIYETCVKAVAEY